MAPIAKWSGTAPLSQSRYDSGTAANNAAEIGPFIACVSDDS
jgi:hypothetical protein